MGNLESCPWPHDHNLHWGALVQNTRGGLVKYRSPGGRSQCWGRGLIEELEPTKHGWSRSNWVNQTGSQGEGRLVGVTIKGKTESPLSVRVESGPKPQSFCREWKNQR
jgi:hypothetical protein